MSAENKVLILPNRKSWNFVRWLWLSTNLFITVKFHDVQAIIDGMPQEGGRVPLLPGTYLVYKEWRLRDHIEIIGAGRGSVLSK